MISKIMFSMLLFSMPLLTVAQSLRIDWVVEHPCYSPNVVEYDKVVTDAEQNVYLCGKSVSWTSPFFNGSAIFTQKYDSTGSVLWESQLDGMFSDNLLDCTLNGNYGFLVGGTRGYLPGSQPPRAEIASYNPAIGEELWHNYFFDTLQQRGGLKDIDLDNDGNIYAFGQVRDNANPDYESSKLFVAKLDPLTGDSIWLRISQIDFLAEKGKVLSDRIRIHGGKFLGPSNYVRILQDIDLDGKLIASVDLPLILYGISPSYFFFDNEGFFIGFGTVINKFGLSETPVWTFDFARGLPNMKGLAQSAVHDDQGNIYATGYLEDTVTFKSYTQTVKLSPMGDLLWATVDTFSAQSILEEGTRLAISDSYVFVCSTIVDENEDYDYRPMLYSTDDGGILYDTLVNVNTVDMTFYAHYALGHFYLLGRSYDPESSSQDDYMYKLFKFSVDGTSSTSTKPEGDFHPVRIFPNPTTNGNTTIVQAADKQYDQLFLYDLHGSQLFSKRLEKMEQHIRLPEIGAGTYIIKLVGKKSVYTDKLIVQR